MEKRKNLTLKELGEKVGMRDNTLSQYENEKRNPNDEIWRKLAVFFDVSTDYIKGLSHERTDPYESIGRIINKINFTDDKDKNDKIREQLFEAFAIVLESTEDKLVDLESRIDNVDPNYHDPSWYL
ncbi:helix-turn-helix domain-containing protein [Limosilactobacillus reuteri]|uniref:helix-turn-helix domain-containing protein n=1 Tax=Limosilactobacillus reuteri TaxID=1598 RepID=UPI00227FEC93|nr:helix-turn-helix transcriptional regulator [Limosilactobacillus reuteri]